MKVAKPKAATVAATMPRGIFFAGLLAILLAVLFWKSFLPGYVHFSNDGPLGQQNTAWARLPDAFAGIWGDLNDIGNSGGSLAPDLCTLLRWLLGPVGYSKFLAPFALFILGLGAWTFFRQLKFSPLAATLGGMAAALNSAFFSTACWGVASQQVAIGFSYFALALVVSNTPDTPVHTRWLRWVLAGLAVGANVMQGADIGAIFSVFIAAFVLFKTLGDESGSVVAKLGRSVVRVTVIAVFAGFIAWQTVTSLIGTSITGIAGTGQDAETKAKQWNPCTQWSEPKIETLDLFVPGLFGYKMDTPNNMGLFQDAYRGGQYWGAIGRDAAWEQYFASGRKGPAPDPRLFIRQTGGGGYAGILVALLAAWAIAQSLRRQNSVFGKNQRRMIWFWFAVLVISLPLSFGRFGLFGGYPFRFLYELPGASLIRNPTKFILIFSWAIVILFAYGVQGLSRRYLETSAANIKSSISQLQSWWKNARGFDRKWTLGCVFAFVGAVLLWLIYASQKPALISYLQTVEAPGDPKEIAAFSIGQAGWFLLFFALAIGIVILIIAGIFPGRRARFGGLLLGAVMLVDLGRANLPWLTYWDYKQKYDIDSNNLTNSINPIINLLRDKPYEHRVILSPFAAVSQLPAYDDYFGDIYRIEWVQHHFPYYNIQSLDLVMRPRVGSDLELYERTMAFRGTQDTLYLFARHWQLTNTRYILATTATHLPMGDVDTLSFLNQGLDPVKQRFRIVQHFDIKPKPGIEQVRGIQEMTAVLNENGGCALYEFTGALARAKLYSDWQVSTNDEVTLKQWLAELKPYLPDETYGSLTNLNVVDQATLKTLNATNFDPQQTVLLAGAPAAPNPPATATNENSGTVEFTSYTPKDIKFHTQAATPTVLLLNDQYDPHWRVTVDGKPAPLLRANFIMRGVYLPAGEHSVEFQFSLPVKPLYVTLSAMIVGVLLCGLLVVLTRKSQTSAIPQRN